MHSDNRLTHDRLVDCVAQAVQWPSSRVGSRPLNVTVAVRPGPVIARAAIHVDAPNMLQEQYLATNATLPAYCPSNALLKLQTDAGVARV
jgi:hypothetical protein